MLLALSEHVGFTPAWVVASLIGAVINGVYLQAVLKGWRNSLLFVAVLLLLDGVMWLLLRSEDSALLLGTGVLLLALCALMFLTRRVDWYALSLPQSNPQNRKVRMKTRYVSGSKEIKQRQKALFCIIAAA